MTTSAPSTRAIVLAVAGLVIIPAVALIVVISQNDPKPVSVEPEHAPADVPASSLDRPARGPEARAQHPNAAVPATAQAIGVEAGSESALANERLALARRIENTDPKRSRELLRKVLEVDPKNPRALESLATKLLIDENFAEAVDLASRCVGVNAASSACAKIAQLNFKPSPEFERLSKLNDECVRNTPDNVTCAYAKFSSQILNGQAQEATLLSDRMSQVSPNDALAQMARGRLKAVAGAYGDARALFEAACKQGNGEGCFRADVLRSEGW